MSQTLINMDDLWIPEFVESCTIDGQAVECISTPIDTEIALTEMGADEEIDLALLFKISTPKPLRGALLTFRGRAYRVKKHVEDSIAASYRVYLSGQWGGR